MSIPFLQVHPMIPVARKHERFHFAKCHQSGEEMKAAYPTGFLCVFVAAGCMLGGQISATAAAMDSNEKTVMVGGAAMYPSKNIVQNAVNSKDHTTLVAAVKAGGLVDTLSSPGPFTVFAPTNEAFAALPAGTVDTLLKPENKGTLVKVLTYHVVPGRMSSQDLMKTIKDSGGAAVLTTAEGDKLTVRQQGSQLTVTDDKGGVAHVTISDVFQSNGVIFVVDKVLLP
ncbi:fasciclin [Pandoraea sputorum]|nr:fasciclin [Pandoraea sputorum]